MRIVISLLICFMSGSSGFACNPEEFEKSVDSIPKAASTYIEMPSKTKVYELIQFIEKDHNEITDPDYIKGIEIAKSRVKLGDLYNCITPFLGNTYPAKNAGTVKALNTLEASMQEFVYRFNEFFLCLLAGRTYDPILMSSEHKRYDIVYTEELRPFFQIAQGIGNRFAEVMKHYKRHDLTKDYGIFGSQSNKAVGYIKDCNGFLFFPTPYSNTLVSAEIPYGEPRLGRTRKVLYQGDQIITQSGFMAAWDGGEVFPLQITGITGAHHVHPFFLSPSGYSYTPLPHNNPGSHIIPALPSETPFFQASKTSKSTSNATSESSSVASSSDLVLPKSRTFVNEFIDKQMFVEKLLDLQTLKRPNMAFAAIPETPEEYDLIQILLLEDLIDARKNTKSDEYLMICDQIGVIEEEVKKPIEEYLEEQKEGLISKFENQISSTQAETKPHNFKENTTKKKHKKGKQKPSGKKQKKSVQAPGVSKTQARQKAEEDASNFLVEGRQKWRNVLKLVNLVVKKYPALRQANINIAGSHITFHESGKESVTVAPKHSGRKEDLTLPAGTVNNFVGRLLKFAFQAN